MVPRQLDPLIHLGDERPPCVLRLRAIASVGKPVADEIDHKKTARHFDLLVEEVKRSQAITKLVVGLIPNGVCGYVQERFGLIQGAQDLCPTASLRTSARSFKFRAIRFGFDH